MKDSPSVSVPGEPAGRARQRSYVALEKWEESWIAQQRTVTAVIRQDTRPDATASDTHVHSAARHESTATPDRVAGPEGRGGSMKSEAPGGGTCDAIGNPGDAVRKARAASSSVAVAPVPAFVANEAGEVQQAADARASYSGARSGLKQFAFWRTGTSLDVAMRLRDPERETAGIVTQLRLWLREGGAQLRKVIVNGRAVLHEHPGGAPVAAGKGASRLDRHI